MANEDEDRQVKPFAAFLREQDSGASHDELSEGLHELIQRVRETGKKGSITYTVTVETPKGNDKVLMITDSISVKKPEFPRSGSMYFVDKQGNPVRDNPEQQTLPLEVVRRGDDEPLHRVERGN